MAVTKDYEVVSIHAVTDTVVRIGVAPIGRIAQYSQQAGDPNTRGVVHSDLSVDWDTSQSPQPQVGAVISATFEVPNV